MRGLGGPACKGELVGDITVRNQRLGESRLVVRPLAVAAGVAAMLYSVATAQPSGDPGRKELTLSAPGGARVTLRRGEGYLPGGVLLWPGQKQGRVTVSSVRLGGLESASATCMNLPGEQATLTTIKPSKGAVVTLRTAVQAREPVVHLEMTGLTGDVVIRLAGVDRASFRRGIAFNVVNFTGAATTKVSSARVALQNRLSQDGVVIRKSGGAGAMIVTVADGAVEVRIKAGGAAVTVTMTAFRGDASVAIEDAIAPAEPATVVAKAPRGFMRGWKFFSNTPRAFAPLLADQREAQVRAGFSHDRREGDIHADLVFGGDLGIMRKDEPNGDATTFTVRSLISARLNMNTDSTDVMNNDYFGGVAYGRRRGRNSWEFYVYHESAHLGDETLDFGKRKRIDYGREAVRLLYARQFGDLRVYGGPTQNLSASDSFNRMKSAAQAGAEYRFRCWGRPLYVAGDVHVREENKWKPHLTTQVGMELGDPEAQRRRTRLFLEFYTGYSNMGQYWNEYETSVMLGLGFNW